MFAEQNGSFVVRQAMLNIHFEIVLAECEDEFPHRAVVVLGGWAPASVDTFGHQIDLRPKLLPCPSGCLSWFSRFPTFGNIAVVHKPRLDVTAFDEQWAPLEDIDGPFLPVRGGILVDNERYRML